MSQRHKEAAEKVFAAQREHHGKLKAYRDAVEGDLGVPIVMLNVALHPLGAFLTVATPPGMELTEKTKALVASLTEFLKTDPNVISIGPAEVYTDDPKGKLGASGQ